MSGEERHVSGLTGPRVPVGRQLFFPPPCGRHIDHELSGLTAPCPDCQHAIGLHPGTASPAVRVCVICEAQTLIYELKRLNSRPSSIVAD
jgi:hypothetical protein